MSKPIRISEELMKLAEEESSHMMRSIPKQIEYWSELGRLVEQTGVISLAQIRAFREGRISIDELTNQERLTASRSVLDDAVMNPNRERLKADLMSRSGPAYSIEGNRLDSAGDEIVVNKRGLTPAGGNKS